MKPKTNSKSPKSKATKVVKDIRRASRKLYSAEEKIRIVIEGLRGESSIAQLCRLFLSGTSLSHRQRMTGFRPFC